jgi:hypothetical protein
MLDLRAAKSRGKCFTQNKPQMSWNNPFVPNLVLIFNSKSNTQGLRRYKLPHVYACGPGEARISDDFDYELAEGNLYLKFLTEQRVFPAPITPPT